MLIKCRYGNKNQKAALSRRLFRLTLKEAVRSFLTALCEIMDEFPYVSIKHKTYNMSFLDDRKAEEDTVMEETGTKALVGFGSYG